MPFHENAQISIEYAVMRNRPLYKTDAPVKYKLQDSDIPKLTAFIGKEKKSFGEIATHFSGNHLNVKKFVLDHPELFIVDKNKMVSAKK